jgi:tetratricopeptide (TPR) repeat protein
MSSSRWSLQRGLTWLGLVLLAGALVVVVANLLLHPFPPGDPFRPIWLLLKVGIAGVLLVSWVFLNVPEAKSPSGPFVLAIAQFGELQATGAGWQIVPGQRSLGDQARELVEDSLLAFLSGNADGGQGAGQNRPPWLSRLDSLTRPAAPRPAPPNGRSHGEETTHLPRLAEGEGAAIQRPPIRPLPAGGGNTMTLARPLTETAMEGSQPDSTAAAVLRPEPMPQRAPAATEWLFNTLRTRWSETEVAGLVPIVVDFAPDAATARALAAAVPAVAAVWGVVRAGEEPAVWIYVELRANLEQRAQSEDVELRLAGLSAFPLAPITPQAPEIVLSMLTGLAYYAAGHYQEALNEWNLSLITAIVAHDNPPQTPLSALAVAHFYRGNAAYLMGSLHVAAKAYEGATAAAPRLAEAHHNLGLVYHALGRLDEAREQMEAASTLNPRLALARYHLGVILLSLNQLDEAAGIFRELIARNPANAEAHRALGRVHRAAKRYDLAERELYEALRLRSGYFDAHLDLAALYYELTAQYPDDVPQHQEQAPEASPRRQLLDKAAAELRQALELRPNSLDAHYNFGLVLYGAHELEDAADEFREVIRLRGDFRDAREMLDLVFRSQGPADQEPIRFRESTALQPANAATFINLGLLEYEEKDYREAVEKFQRALHLEPRNPEAHFHMGRTLARLNDARAIGHLKEALGSARPSDEAAHELATIYRQQGKLDDAFRVLQEQIGRNPADAQALYVVGTIYAHRKQIDEAIDFFRTAIRYNPNLAPAHYNLGVAYTAKNRLYDALSEFERLVELTPQDPQAHCVLGVAHKDLRNYAPALEELEKAVQIKPDYVEALYNLGLVYQALDKPERALEAFRDALRQNPTHPGALYRLGTTYAATGQIDAAIGVFQRVVDANPEMAEAHYNLGVAYNVQHNYAGAMREFQAVVQLRPNDAEAFNNLGLAYRRGTRIEEAIEAFRRAVTLKPDYAEAYYNLGQAYTAINETKQAIQAFRVYEDLAK